MELEHYETLLRTEEAARQYFLSFCWNNDERWCPRCRHGRIYSLSEGRYRCGACGYTFHDFSRRFINNGNLSPREWLRLLKLFELEVSPQQMARQLGRTYNTVSKAVQSLRGAIMAHALDAQLIFESGLGSSLGTARTKRIKKGSGGGPLHALVFGVIPLGRLIFVDLLPDLTDESIIHLKSNFYLKTASLGSLIYTDRYKQYDTLLCCAASIQHIPHAPHNDTGLFVNGQGGFWKYAKKRLKSSRRVSCRNFALYIKELEFRYNHRSDDMFTILASYLCDFVPKLK